MDFFSSMSFFEMSKKPYRYRVSCLTTNHQSCVVFFAGLVIPSVWLTSWMRVWSERLRSWRPRARSAEGKGKTTGRNHSAKQSQDDFDAAVAKAVEEKMAVLSLSSRLACNLRLCPQHLASLLSISCSCLDIGTVGPQVISFSIPHWFRAI